MVMKLLINHLSFGYIKRPLSVVDFSCELSGGENLALLGGEGAGKTSLLRIISGLEKQYAGTMFFDKKNAELISLEERNFSYIPSDPVIFFNKTIYQNLKFLFDVINKPFDENIAVSVLNKFGIDEPLNTKMKKLSSAKQKVFTLVRCFIKKPQLILLDDLFKDENEEDCIFIKNAILTLFNEKSAQTSMIYVENSKNQLKIANQYFYFSFGKNYKIDDIETLKKNPIDLFACDFFENNKKDYSLMFDGNNYYLLDQEFVYKKNKIVDVKNLRQIKLGANFNYILEKQKLHESEQMEVTVVSFVKIDDLSDEKLNTIAKNNQIFIFDKNTFIKVL